MPVYTGTTDPLQNSYVSLQEAEDILLQRLYVDSWGDASASPSAYEYTINDPGETLVVGATSIPIAGGSGVFATSQVSFQRPIDTFVRYNVVSETSSTLNIAAPGLQAVPVHGTAVHRLTPNEREKAILWATIVLDTHFEWYGTQRYISRATRTGTGPFQNLRWPRVGAQDADGYLFHQDDIPRVLREATAELGMYLLKRDLATLPALLGLGLKSVSMPGPLQIVIDRSMIASLVPAYIIAKLADIGEPRNMSGMGTRTVPLRRV